MPEESNPSGKSQVVGYCYIKPDMDSGEITAEGASFFWEDGRVGQRTGFTSTLVRGIQNNKETICHIQFDINKEDRRKRYYSHGALQFQLTRNAIGETANDVYAGYLESYNKDAELQSVVVRAKGYAEWNSKGCVPEGDLKAVLQQRGTFLFANLELIKKLTPPPALWVDNTPMSSNKANIWKHDIPTPQSVILNDDLRPFVERYLSNVLTAFGLDDSAIRKFQTFAQQKAKDDDAVAAYEWELKAGLIRTGLREDKPLNERAEIIFGEIKPFLTGESLLDIGCGNGLISSLARSNFKQVQLLDVVEYVPKALNLPFKPYIEGQPLPISESFDTVLLLTVLHHSTAPVELLKLAWGVTKQRLIVIESVVGVHNVEPPIKYELAALTNEYQIAFAAFVDWFYNRVLHDDVPVPYNFTTIQNWQATFLQHNMRLVRTIHFGQDIEIGPEYHVLFVLEKEQPNNSAQFSNR